MFKAILYTLCYKWNISLEMWNKGNLSSYNIIQICFLYFVAENKIWHQGEERRRQNKYTDIKPLKNNVVEILIEFHISIWSKISKSIL